MSMQKFFKLFSIMALSLIAFSSFAQENEPKPGTIVVTGQAMVSLEADYVMIEIVSEHSDNNARTAYKQTVEEMSKAIAFLKTKKSVDKLKTTNVMLNPRITDYKSGNREYNARQSLSFKLTDVAQYDEIMLSLIDMGINGIGQVNFLSSEAEKYEEILIRQAVQDARKKAVILASELGQEVGRAKHITDNVSSGPQPMMSYKMAAFSDEMGPSVAPGSLKISASVNIQFELK